MFEMKPRWARPIPSPMARMILPPTEEANRVHGPVSGWLAEIAGEAYDGETSIVYGGKVKPHNACKILAGPP